MAGDLTLGFIRRVFNLSNNFGYQGSGVGGTVTQATDKSTGVTLNKLCGAVTMNNASLAGGAEVSFTVTNSKVANTDTVVVNLKKGSGTAGSYGIWAAPGAGTFDITVSNLSTGALAEAIVINFAIVKSATA